MKNISVIIIISIFISINACKTKRNAQRNSTYYQRLDTLNITPQNSITPYKASAHKFIDITHMDLSVDFDFQKQTMHGIAVLTIRPYFYATDSIVLKAKSMDINSIKLLKSGFNSVKKYTYENDNIVIHLTNTLAAIDTIILSIDYTANPEKIKKGTGKAITADKGLYFINPLKTEANKPTQIWTQGESEAASCWFPTVEATNEKFTHNIQITVPDNYKTISNGKLVNSQLHKGSVYNRTDYWQMTQPNAPYLVMLAVGEFEIIKQTWRGKEVSYYLEKEFAPFAQQNFGDTPQMLEFFSNYLSVEYPWVNYKQFVARDFVSGAMENTTATLHGEFMNKTKEQSIDAPPYDYYHDVVAHELFHHWFGDLVTCESWSNLPLNESFASYGEILWIEHKYGKEAGALHLNQQLEEYLQESRSKQVNMIRYDYQTPDDMFDGHSYQKGARILHMLRKYVGEDAFKKSLTTYLRQNQYKNAELANLRMAFEEVTGQDLNWFFNQWFFNPGHPSLNYNYSYNDATQMLTLNINQTQQNDGNDLIYDLPTSVSIYTNDKITKYPIRINKIDQTILIPCKQKPTLALIDADDDLLAVKNDTVTAINQLESLAQLGNSYVQKQKIINGAALTHNDYKARKLISDMCNDNFDGTAIEALNVVNTWTTQHKAEVLSQIKNIARTNKNVLVRSSALSILIAQAYKDDAEVETIMNEVLKNDSSANNKAYAIRYVLSNNKPMPTEKLLEYEKCTDANTLIVLAQNYSEKLTPNKFEFMKYTLTKLKQRDLVYISSIYTQYTIGMVNTSEMLATANYLIAQTKLEQRDWAKVYSYYNVKDIIKASKNQAKKTTDAASKQQFEQLTIELELMLKNSLATETSEELKINVNDYK
jgi:aminopeptidase N